MTVQPTQLQKIDIKQQPLLIFGGCYSNFQATQALYEWAQTNGFAPEQCICTGDIIAYCAQPIETATLIKEWGVHCIQGNVEQSLADEADDCGCGFESGTTCDVLSKGWYPFANLRTSVELRQWFRELPMQLSFDYAGKQVQVVHGAPSHISKFMFASHSEADFNQEFDQTNADIILAGHSGLPFTKQVANKTWHNSGALGMPANDGTDRVWFSVMSADNDGHVSFEHHALSYDAKIAQQKMENAGLTQGYEKAITTGLWPSMDVLLEEEKAKVGQQIIL